MLHLQQVADCCKYIRGERRGWVITYEGNGAGDPRAANVLLSIHLNQPGLAARGRAVSLSACSISARDVNRRAAATASLTFDSKAMLSINQSTTQHSKQAPECM